MSGQILSPSLHSLACSSGYKSEWAVLLGAEIISGSIKRDLGVSVHLLFSGVT